MLAAEAHDFGELNAVEQVQGGKLFAVEERSERGRPWYRRRAANAGAGGRFPLETTASVDPPRGRQCRHARQRGAKVAEIRAPFSFRRHREREIALPGLAVEGDVRAFARGKTLKLVIEVRLDVLAALLEARQREAPQVDPR